MEFNLMKVDLKKYVVRGEFTNSLLYKQMKDTQYLNKNLYFSL